MFISHCTGLLLGEWSLGGVIAPACSVLIPTHLQIASDQHKLTKEFYGPAGVFRIDSLRSKMIDSLYHLNNIDFDCESGAEVDAGWPRAAISLDAPDALEFEETRAHE